MSSAPPHKTDDRSLAYRKPELRKYGQLTQITTAVGNMGIDDAGVPPTHKTGV